jgi:tRNA-modifying protein YgfZ
MKKSPSLCHIDNHCLLLVKGVDAKKFLQGQVSCDINALTISENQYLVSSLGVHCTHKGRIIFSFRALPLDEETIALNIPTEMLETAINALKKYIVFAKAALINASQDYQLIGVDGDNATAIIQSTMAINTLPTTADHAIQNDRGIVLCLGENRYELWLSTQQHQTFQAQTTDMVYNTAKYWDLVNINARIAEVRLATTDVFTPHALNFQSTGTTISFKKGCYTGQEVVARMHYLGKPKRQLFLFEIALEQDQCLSLIHIGAPVYTSDKTQSIGEIVLAAKTNNNGVRLLASVTTDAAENDQIFVDNACTFKLNLLTD